MRFTHACAAVLFAVTGFSLAGVSHAATNLLLNPGAELGTNTNPGTVDDWTVGGTSNPGRDNGTFDNFVPHSGSFDFYGDHGASGTLTQVVDLVASGVNAGDIDSGTLSLDIQFFEQSLNQGVPSDNASVGVTFQDASDVLLSGGYQSGTIASTNLTWQEVDGSAAIPVGARFVTYQMTFQLEQGGDLDSYIDDNSLTIGGQVTPPPNTGVPLPPAVWSGLALLGGLGVCNKLRRRKAAAL